MLMCYRESSISVTSTRLRTAAITVGVLETSNSASAADVLPGMDGSWDCRTPVGQEIVGKGNIL